MNSQLCGEASEICRGSVGEVDAAVTTEDRSKRAGELCLLAICLLVPLGKPIAFEALGMNLRIGILDLLTVPAAIILLVRLQGLKPTWPVVFILSYGFAVVISTLFTTSPELRTPTLLRALRLCAILLPFLLAVTLDFDEGRLERLMNMFLVGGGISLVVGLILWAFHKQLGVDLPWAGYVSNGHKLVAARASGVFGDYIAYGHLAAVWFVIAVFKIARLSGIRRSAACCGALALASCALVASLSRGALFYIAVAVPALLLSPWPSEWKRSMRKVALAMICSFAGLAALAFLWRPTPIEKGLEVLYLRVNTVGISAALNGKWDLATSNRLDNWAEYSRLIAENPVTGIGYKTLFIGKGIPPDNTYLGTLVETGVLGFVALTGFLFAMLRGLLRASLWYPPALLVIALWAGCIAEGITNDFLTFWGTTPVLMAMTGAAITATDNDRSAHSPECLADEKATC